MLPARLRQRRQRGAPQQAIIRAERPDLAVSLSSRVLPEIGEYGRVSTTVANAYVQPLMSRYLARAVGGPEGAGLARRLLRDELQRRHAQSRPRPPVPGAAGRVRARCRRLDRHAFCPAACGTPNVLAFDMGGTTAKISLITGGQPTRTTELEVARVRRFQKGSGLLLKAPGGGPDRDRRRRRQHCPRRRAGPAGRRAR